MAVLPHKSILAITAVIDIALHGRQRPVSARSLAMRHGLPPRHLEPVLQALVREQILKGTRGPGGGYALARDGRGITADAILRAAGIDDDGPASSGSTLLRTVVLPALESAERVFSDALRAISVDDIVRRAEPAE